MNQLDSSWTIVTTQSGSAFQRILQLASFSVFTFATPSTAHFGHHVGL